MLKKEKKNSHVIKLNKINVNNVIFLKEKKIPYD